MNTELDRLQELEWQAQERALRELRERIDLHSTDPRVAEYRLIARALRQPMPDLLPAHFARDLAARVGNVPLDTRLERWLMRVLIGAMVVSGLVAAMVYGGDWWNALAGSVPQASATTINWMLAAGACVAGSWLFERVRLGAMRQHGAPA